MTGILGVLAGAKGGPAVITSLAQFSAETVVGQSYFLKSPNAPTAVQFTVTNGYNGNKGIYLGSALVNGTSWPGDSGTDVAYSFLGGTTYSNLQAVSEVFIGGLLSTTPVSGSSEGGFDYYGLYLEFGCVSGASVYTSGGFYGALVGSVYSHVTSSLYSTFVATISADGSVYEGSGIDTQYIDLWLTV
jgi:hypothetical protein